MTEIYPFLARKILEVCEALDRVDSDEGDQGLHELYSNLSLGAVPLHYEDELVGHFMNNGAGWYFDMATK